MSALKHNYLQLSGMLSTGKLMPVIKADAYGHGAVNAAKALEILSESFAVAIVEEAISLRQAGINKPIVILEGAFCKNALKACHEFALTPVIHNQHQLSDYEQLAQNERPPVWLKVDIGMHRLGFPDAEIETVFNKLTQLHHNMPVLCGHFSDADDADCPVTQAQMARLIKWQSTFNCQASLANSPAIIHWPQSHVQWNRAGIALYGIAPNIDVPKPPSLKPVMTLSAPVIAIREVREGESVGYGGSWQAQRHSVIATIAIGYADGYPRHAPSGTPVWFNGHECPLAGRVSMDMITIDVTNIDNISIGDTVELWGKNLAVEKVAKYCQTIGYELVTRVGPRVPRIVEESN